MKDLDILEILIRQKSKSNEWMDAVWEVDYSFVNDTYRISFEDKKLLLYGKKFSKENLFIHSLLKQVLLIKLSNQRILKR